MFNLYLCVLWQIKELNSYVTLRKTYQSSLGNKRIELFDAGNDHVAEDNVQMASAMSNQQLIDSGTKQMDQTDQAIERSKMVHCNLTLSFVGTL
jgi:SNARE protein